MDSRSAPQRLRMLPSWLIGQNALLAQQLVTSALAAVDAHRYHFSMLAALDESGPMSQAELGRRCGLDRSDITAAVTELADRQFVERAPDPENRRQNIVRITRSGRRQLVTLGRVIEKAQDELMSPLTEVERRQLIRLLIRLTDRA